MRKVNELVEQRLMEKLLPNLIDQHKRHGYKKQCDCDFCTLRMEIGSQWRARRKAERIYRYGVPYRDIFLGNENASTPSYPS